MTQNKDALEWVEDAFADINESRMKLRKSNPVLDRAEKCLKTIRAALERPQVDVDGLSGTIESQKQTHDALIKKLCDQSAVIRDLAEALRLIQGCAGEGDIVGMAENALTKNADTIKNAGA